MPDYIEIFGTTVRVDDPFVKEKIVNLAIEKAGKYLNILDVLEEGIKNSKGLPKEIEKALRRNW